jgi:hypothetical protein
MLNSSGDETATLLCEVLAALGNIKEGVLKLLVSYSFFLLGYAVLGIAFPPPPSNPTKTSIVLM